MTCHVVHTNECINISDISTAVSGAGRQAGANEEAKDREAAAMKLL